MHFLDVFWVLLLDASGLSVFKDRVVQEKAQDQWRSTKNVRGLAQEGWENLVD